MTKPPPSAAAALAQVPTAPLPLHPAAPGVHRMNSDRLFGGAQELQIEHRGALYRLKQTALGKLILTK